eukprot:m.46469 g.46469  ORF g.46469 m.46469 type:complete len:138 (-) comp11134_c0_seq2:794-1207(-)
MVVVVLSKAEHLSGNVATARRICAMVPGSIHVGCCPSLLADTLALLREHQAHALIAIHALHGGSVAVASGLPFALVLGGTDVNEEGWVLDEQHTMAAAVARARCALPFDLSRIKILFASCVLVLSGGAAPGLTTNQT